MCQYLRHSKWDQKSGKKNDLDKVDGMKQEGKLIPNFQRQGHAYRNERLVIFKEEGESCREKKQWKIDEERFLQGDWTELKLRR